MRFKYLLYLFLAIVSIVWSTMLFGKDFGTIRVHKTIIPVELAKTRSDQSKGLGYRDKLKSFHGMLFIYPAPGKRIFWMKGMKFSIDIIWILKNTIVHIEKNVPFPPLMTSDQHLRTYGHTAIADKVLELNSGEAQQLKLTLGQQLEIIY